MCSVELGVHRASGKGLVVEKVVPFVPAEVGLVLNLVNRFEVEHFQLWFVVFKI
jgi:hypothetical protein